MSTYQAVLALSSDLGTDYSVTAREQMTIIRGNLQKEYSLTITDLRDNQTALFTSFNSMDEAVKISREAMCK